MAPKDLGGKLHVSGCRINGPEDKARQSNSTKTQGAWTHGIKRGGYLQSAALIVGVILLIMMAAV